MKLMLVFGCLLTFLSGNTVSSLKTCNDTATWCNDHSSRCKSYPVPPDMMKNCKKTCHVCNEDGSCGLGYYGDVCSPCKYRCTGWDCVTVTGSECPQNCPAGKRGMNCSENCPPGCLESCDRWTDICVECQEGKRGLFCNQTCPEQCKHCNRCLKNKCNSSGICLDGCTGHYWGDHCQNSCPSGCIDSECYANGTCTKGCVASYYGLNCSTKCSSHCKLDNSSKKRLCNRYSGNCTNKCVKGWYLRNCTEKCSENCKKNLCYVPKGKCKRGCKPGWFGKQCSKRCPPCKNQTCDRDTGSCFYGCLDGFLGNFCNLTCSEGYFGEMCSENCSNNCVNSTCSFDTGLCNQGCIPGYYGMKCDLNCSDNCRDHKCQQDTGGCVGGCIEGYFGEMCSEKCSSNCVNSNCSSETGFCNEGCSRGYYGDHCNKTCFSCKDNTCYQNNGTCLSGCQPGSYGMKCDLNCSENCKPRDNPGRYIYCDQTSGRCLDGCVRSKYGDDCSRSCSDACVGRVCNQTSGNCLYGCAAGWYGIDCSRRCSSLCAFNSRFERQCNQTTGHCLTGCQQGYYGTDCSLQCDKRCFYNICEMELGKCVQGCVMGWKGPYCKEECSHGYYGQNCNLTCGHCTDQLPCDRFTGKCPKDVCAAGFTGIYCNQAVSELQTSSDKIMMISVIAVAAAVFVFIVAVIVTLVYRRQKANANRPRNDEYDMISNSTHDTGLKITRRKGWKKAVRRKKKEVNGTSAEGAAVGVNSADECESLLAEDTVIKLSNLWNHVQHMKNKSLFTKQFEKLPSGLIESCNIAMKPANRVKNRYRNICAYDNSRVILQCEPDDPDSDYINACYIDGFRIQKQYIASQGPVDGNLNDFWRMIWQQKTSKIVMLTNLVEEGRIKCITYWPELDDESVKYGQLEVKCISVDVLAHFTIRTFKIHSITENSPSRLVKHFHYTSWPDRGVPTDVASLVEFYFRVVKTHEECQSPLVVHCSAGIGRTGTFLALSYLYEASKHQDFVNIFQCVSNMRHQRVNMVQTVEQYEFLHDALVEAILAGDTTVSSLDFLPNFEKLQSVNPVTGVVRLREQFELLNKVSPTDSLEEYSAARLPDNTARNRFNDILASNYYRPYLSTPVEGGTDYINAVVLPAYRNKHMFLLTQMPLKNTVVDFWRMIYESNSNTIVMLNSVTQQSQSIGIYWPSMESVVRFGPFEIEKLQHESLDFFNIITLSLKNWKHDLNGEKKEIKLFQCVFWPHGHIVPMSAVPLFTLMEHVEKQPSNGPVTVHCIDGVERSGLYCVLTAIIDRLKIEQDVSIVQTINQMRACRNQLIRSYTQFEFCYKAVQEYFESYSIYSNYA